MRFTHTLHFLLENESKKPLLPAQKQQPSASFVLLTMASLASSIAVFTSFILTMVFNGNRFDIDSEPNPNKPGRFNGTTWCKKHEPMEPLANCLNQLRQVIGSKLMVAEIVLGVSSFLFLASLIALCCNAFRNSPVVKKTQDAVAPVNKEIEEQSKSSFGL